MVVGASGGVTFTNYGTNQTQDQILKNHADWMDRQTMSQDRQISAINKVNDELVELRINRAVDRSSLEMHLIERHN